jgi:hypothetical protein
VGPTQDLDKIKEKFIAECHGYDNDDVVKFFKDGTLLLQTTDQDNAGTLLVHLTKTFKNVKIFEDEENARDCTCGGAWCPDEKWSGITNVDKLVKGLVKPVKEKK